MQPGEPAGGQQGQSREVTSQTAPQEPSKGSSADTPSADAPKERRISRRSALVAAMVALALAAGFGAWGYTLTTELGRERATLASTEAERVSTGTTLASTRQTMTDTQAELETATESRLDREAVEASLRGQVADSLACIDLQQEVLHETRAISELETDNFNRTAEDSDYEKAAVAREAAVTAVLDAYYEAYNHSFDGRAAAAREAGAEGDAARKTIAAHDKTLATEQAAVDAGAAAVDERLDKLNDLLAEAEATCAKVAP